MSLDETLTHKQRIKRIYNEVAINNHLQSYTVEEIHSLAMAGLRSFLMDESAPRVIIKEFGTFRPSLELIDRQLRKLSKDEDKEEIEYYKRVKEAIIEELLSRRNSDRSKEYLQGHRNRTKQL